MFAYCLNNPIHYTDYSGQVAEDATDPERKEEKDRHRIVGAGIQVNIDAGCGTIGFEIILYWDTTVCGDGNWIVTVYTYGGISVETNDAWIASTIAIMTDNANLLMADAENNVSQLVILVASSIGSGFSFSVSGLAIFGNESFTSPESYEQSFTSINVGIQKVKSSLAYSDTGFAVSLGYNCIGGYKLFPSWGISKTYYKLEQKYVIPAPGRELTCTMR